MEHVRQLIAGATPIRLMQPQTGEIYRGKTEGHLVRNSPRRVICASIGRAPVTPGGGVVVGEGVVAGVATANRVGDGCFTRPSAGSLAAVL